MLTSVFAFSVCGIAAAQTKKTFTVVIDPGHGGDDPGAVSGKVQEKALNLDIALALGKIIEDCMPDVAVIYTRKDDRYVTLARRGQIANRAGADLFFSIHMNSNRKLTANGSETYVLGVHKNEESLEAAMRENEVMRYEDDRTEVFENFDPSSAESYIIFTMMQYAHFDRSLQLARLVQNHYNRNTPMRDRGAKQAGYAVLYGPAMPSVLTEVGFMSNDTDRKYIASQAGKDKIVRSLYDAFREYRESVQPAAVTPAEQPKPAVVTEKPAPSGLYVQLFATRVPVEVFEPGVIEHKVDGWYKYCTGPYKSQDEATKARDRARRGKYKDAFIVTL